MTSYFQHSSIKAAISHSLANSVHLPNSFMYTLGVPSCQRWAVEIIFAVLGLKAMPAVYTNFVCWHGVFPGIINTIQRDVYTRAQIAHTV